MRLGIADHLGWAVAVTATDDHHVVDRRRLELIEPDVPPAPIEHDTQGLARAAAERLLAKVRASVERATTAALDELAADLPEPIVSVSLRTWPPDFPDDIDVQRRPPWSARADAVMYRRVLASVAEAKGWEVELYDAKAVIGQAAAVLGPAGAEALDLPRSVLGPPWTKDHRVALAAAIIAAG